jgi:hypothetical protein
MSEDIKIEIYEYADERDSMSDVWRNVFEYSGNSATCKRYIYFRVDAMPYRSERLPFSSISKTTLLSALTEVKAQLALKHGIYDKNTDQLRSLRKALEHYIPGGGA